MPKRPAGYTKAGSVHRELVNGGKCWSYRYSVVLGRFFMRISEFGGSGPVRIREVKLMSLATAVNSAIALHNLEKTCPSCAYTTEYVGKLRNLLSPAGGQGTRLDFTYAYADFRLAAGTITQSLGNTIFRA